MRNGIRFLHGQDEDGRGACASSVDGAVGTVVLGMVCFKEKASFARLFFVALLIVSVIGLKMA